MLRTLRPAALAAALAFATPAAAIEFQPIGALGIGGAGVARPPDGMAAYWNPGALAFGRSFGAVVGAGAGAIAHDDLVDDVDRLSNLDLGRIDTLTGSPAADRPLAADAVQMIAILRKIDRQQGALSVRAHAAFAQQIRRVGLGVYASGEAATLPRVDSTNILPEVGGSTIGAADLSALGTATASNAFFTAPQRAEIEAALGAAGVAAPANVVNAFDAELAVSNEAGVTPAEATDALVALATAIGSGGPLGANTSALRNRGIGLVEVPLAYGHPIRLGALGTLGLGASVKLMRGRVYASEVAIFGLDAGDIVREIRDTYQDSTTWGVDAGALWQPAGALLVGVVGKHLNSPSFDAPGGPDFEVKPQARAGVAWNPLGWLLLAADLDLTENDTALAGFESRILGGGLELAPVTWLRLRGGGYRNLAEPETRPVLTGGLTIGIPWVTVDVEGAASFGQTTYDGEKYPDEARLQASVTIRF